MRIVSFVTKKGGSGKSTLLRSIAAAALADGLNVVILDTDPQRTTFKWSDRRKAEGRTDLPVLAIEPHQLDAELKRLARSGPDLCLIDTPGTEDVGVAVAIEKADYCVIPVKPTIDDAEAAIDTATQLRTRKRPFAFALTMCTGNQARLNEAAAGLLRHGEVATGYVHNRVDYPDAHSLGLGVTEFNPKGPAAKEISLLWAWLNRAIGGKTA